MKHFISGFLTATVLWIVVFSIESGGILNLFGSDEAEEKEELVETIDTGGDPNDKSANKRGRKGRRRRSRPGSTAQEGPGYELGDGVTGDDLGAPGSREVGMGGPGSEEQLKEAEIDRGIDRVFRGIERCLVLVPSDAPTAGRIVVGMHISSSGNVTKVNLKGPNALIKGECGACIQRNVKSIKYASFDGPDMVVHYPITFE